MKRIIVLSIVILMLINQAFGQWYTRKYHVNSINLLTREQLDESLKASKNNLMGSGICAGMGLGLILVSRYGSWAPETNPTLIQQIMGKKWKNTTAYIFGGALLLGGSTAFVINLGRIPKIKKTLNSNYHSSGSISARPGIIPAGPDGSFSGGISMQYNF
ncbi:MAG: hypothetical protein HXX13_18150 [Bacteroidetes bacterium]|nr:hypothetical protein [Bacteroidota bacterium]